MLDPLSAAISGAAAIGGSVIDYFGARQANRANINMARETNALTNDQFNRGLRFNERMSSTAWQRGVDDMRKAGINPMLAVSQGSASAPSAGGGAYTSGAPQQSTTAGISRHVANALQLASLQKEVEAKDAMIDQSKSQAALNRKTAKRVEVQTTGDEVDNQYKTSTLGKIIQYASPVIDTLSDMIPLARGAKGMLKGGRKLASALSTSTSSLRKPYMSASPRRTGRAPQFTRR